VIPPPRPRRVRIGGRPRIRLRRRPGGASPWWRDITCAVPGGGETSPVAPHRLVQWRLVLSSKRIPFRQVQRGSRVGLYVPIVLERMARQEIAAYELEGVRPSVERRPVSFSNAHVTLMVLLLLVLWHGVRMGWWKLFGLATVPAPDAWSSMGALDVYRVIERGEWFRAVTALTLHADSPHLFSNILFGGAFLVPLCRRTGAGLGFMLTLCAGALGNVLNAVARPLSYVSLGSSTAMFGAVGVLSGLLAFEDGGRGWRRMFVPLAAGVAVLGMLGTEGENTDVGAHLFGLLAGCVVGATAQLRLNRVGLPGFVGQVVLGALALVLCGLCWWLAFVARG